MMSCCGKTKQVLAQGKAIVAGYANVVRGKKYAGTDRRIRTCQKCDENTWMGKLEYSAWLLSHGIEVITNFTELEKLPKLPKYELSKGRRNLYCRLCKCFIPAKASDEKNECLLGRWDYGNG